MTYTTASILSEHHARYRIMADETNRTMAAVVGTACVHAVDTATKKAVEKLQVPDIVLLKTPDLVLFLIRQFEDMGVMSWKVASRLIETSQNREITDLLFLMVGSKDPRSTLESSKIGRRALQEAEGLIFGANCPKCGVFEDFDIPGSRIPKGWTCKACSTK